jgi:hypothetical protein
VGGVGGAGRPGQLPARGDRAGWQNYRNNRATDVRNWTQNNVNVNRIANRPGGWWGGGYGRGYARGYAHGWAGSNAWHGWGGYWGWPCHSSGYWWATATIAGVSGFVLGAAIDDDDDETVIHYDYGDNIYYQNDQVYMNGQPVATSDQYAQQAMQIASAPVPPPPDIAPAEGSPADVPPTPEQEATMEEYAKDWMPLGVFTVAREDEKGEPTYCLQLAVHREGYIAGTAYNAIKDETLPLTGSVDKKTQRVAWQFADNKDVVMETGLYNLTQATAPALLHFGTEKTEPRLLVRMEEPKE